MDRNARRPPVTARRFGHVIAVAVNAAILYAANVWPGWQAVPFLTDVTLHVLWLVNVSLVVGIAANLVYLLYDGLWLRSFGELATTGIGLIVLTRIWQVFPFDFGDHPVNAGLLARFVLAVAIAGSIVGLIVQAVSLVRWFATRWRAEGNTTR